MEYMMNPWEPTEQNWGNPLEKQANAISGEGNPHDLWVALENQKLVEISNMQMAALMAIHSDEGAKSSLGGCYRAYRPREHLRDESLFAVDLQVMKMLALS